MSKPVILTVDDDPDVLNAIERDLRQHFRSDYRIVKVGSGVEALDIVRQLKQRGANIALFLVDERMPEMTGTQFLIEAVALYPEARKVLLTAYADTETAITAINKIGLDQYLTKPWDPPTERLYPVLDDLLTDWVAEVRPPYEGLRVAGTMLSPESFAVKDFLSSNLYPYQWIDLDRDTAMRELALTHSPDLARQPVVFLADGSVLVQPDVRALAERIGMQIKARQPFYDLIVVGGGPAGLAGAVYGASEGLRTILVEAKAPGGQAGTSSQIENYLGFPSGVSGSELARRAVAQAKRFGAELVTPQEVVEIRRDDPYRVVRLADGSELSAYAILLAPGMEVRRLDVPDIDRLVGAGVFTGGDDRGGGRSRTGGRGGRGRELRRAGGDVLLAVCEPRDDGDAGRLGRHRDVAVPGRSHPGDAEHRGAAQYEGDRSDRREAPRRSHADQRRDRRDHGTAGVRAVHLHRDGAADWDGGRAGPARPSRLHPDRPGPDGRRQAAARMDARP